MKFDKSKVFSAVNADEVKVGSKGYFADNLKDLECMVDGGHYHELTRILDESESCRFELRAEDSDDLNFYLFYLVEEPEEDNYRPYKDTKEMIEDFKERAKAYGANFSDCPMFRTMIWLKGKTSDAEFLISGYTKDCVYRLFDGSILDLQDVFERFTYLDGTPCGKKL